jgi:hypothetical protein
MLLLVCWNPQAPVRKLGGRRAVPTAVAARLPTAVDVAGTPKKPHLWLYAAAQRFLLAGRSAPQALRLLAIQLLFGDPLSDYMYKSQ